VTEPVKFYLDTTVLMDFVEPSRGNQNSIELLNHLIDGRTSVAVTSTFALMETVDKKQEYAHLRTLLANGHTLDEIRGRLGKERNLTKADCKNCYADTLRRLQRLGSRFEVYTPKNDDVWTRALSIVQESNISAPDALHVAVAQLTACSVLVTGDEHLHDQISTLLSAGGHIRAMLCQKTVLPRRFRDEFVRLSRPPTPAMPKGRQSQLPKELRTVFKGIAGIASLPKDIEPVLADYERQLRIGRSAKGK
jgi:predicted nucleic acid-binding protein